MKKQIILSSLLSALLIGNCLDTQAANEARTINDLPSMAKSFPEQERGVSGISRWYHRIGTIFIKESKVSDSLQGTENTRQSVGEIYSQERWLYLKYSCYQVCRSLFG